MIDFLKEIQTYAYKYDPIMKNDGCIWLKCPFHGGGQERTASCRINLQKGKYPIGFFYCHGCHKHGLWNDLLPVIPGLSPIEGEELKRQELLLTRLTPQQIDSLYKQECLMGIDFNTCVDWNPKEEWRHIRGDLINKIGGKKFYNKATKLNQLFLPCSQNKIIKGGIRCVLDRKPGEKGYFNTPGPWVKNTLFPYDFVKKFYKERNKILALVEGPRDALNMIQYGFPALAILGSHNWSKLKHGLIELLNPSMLVLAFDNDEAGNSAFEAVAQDFEDFTDKVSLEFKEGQDPGELTGEEVEKYFNKIKKMVESREN